MATVTGFTAERMEAMEAATIVDGDIVGDDLILKRHDDATINAGNVRGPTGSPGVSVGDLDTFMEDQLPIGSTIDYMGSVSPSAKWLPMTGQTVVNAQTLYPTWWGRIPAAMKVGANAVMPDTRGRVAVGYDAAQGEFDTICEVGGEKVHTLAQTELPAAGVQVDPPNTVVAITDPQHYHDLSFPGSGLNSTVLKQSDASHIAWKVPIDFAASPGLNITTDSIAPHATNISAVVNIAQFVSGNMGSGLPHNNLQPYVTFLKLVKVL